MQEKQDNVKSNRSASRKAQLGKAAQRLKSTAKQVGDMLSRITEAKDTISSDAEFKQFANDMLQKAHGEEFNQSMADQTIDGLLSKYAGDYGAMVGALKNSFSEGKYFKEQLVAMTPYDFGQATVLQSANGFEVTGYDDKSYSFDEMGQPMFETGWAESKMSESDWMAKFADAGETEALDMLVRRFAVDDIPMEDFYPGLGKAYELANDRINNFIEDGLLRLKFDDEIAELTNMAKRQLSKLRAKR